MRVVRAEQFSNAPCPNEVSVDGMTVADASVEHPLKAESPSVMRLVGRGAEVSFVQFRNALVPIAVTLAGKVMVVNLQPFIAPAAMVVRVDGRAGDAPIFPAGYSSKVALPLSKRMPFSEA